MLRILALLWLTLLPQAASAQTAASESAGNTPIRVLGLGFTDYPGWAGLNDLPHVPTLAHDLENTGKRLLTIDFYRQEQANRAYIAGEIDLLAISNIDVLFLLAQEETFPPSVVVFLTDISLGADAVITQVDQADPKNGPAIAVLDGRSVASYLLARAMDRNRLGTPDAPVIQDRSADTAAAQFTRNEADIIVLRAPYLERFERWNDGNVAFDSGDVPGEIFGMVIMRKALADDQPDLVNALRRGWFSSNHQVSSELPDPAHVIVTFQQSVENANDQGVQVIADREDMLRFLGRGQFMFDIQRVRDYVTKTIYSGISGNFLIGNHGIAFPNNIVVGDPSRIMLYFQLPE